jgi:hypothetical protein
MEAAMVRLDPLDEDMGQTPSQTEDSRERGFKRDREVAKNDRRGTSDSLDPDESGDIADEGTAHRG